MSHVNSHFDLLQSIAKAEKEDAQDIPIEDDSEIMNMKDGLEKTFERKANASEALEDNINEDEVKVKRQGRKCRSKEYIDKRIYDEIDPITVEKVPDDIDGICVYKVPMVESGSLANCKGSRPWGGQITSKTKDHTFGPRLIQPCRGTYVCQNMSCKNLMDFGFNRSDFVEKRGGKGGEDKKIFCSICTREAKYIPCHAKLIIEEHLENRFCIVKHHGVHTCVTQKQGRPDETEILQILDTNPDITREGIIRQGVKRVLRENGVEAAVEQAQKFTDTKFIDNIIAKRRKTLNPHGHNFEAVRVLQEAWNEKDRFLVYKVNDGSERGFPYVVKSSSRKVELMAKMDIDGEHTLNETVLHLDVVHSRAKGFKTYTLSYYDVVLRSLVKLCTMDTTSECYLTCKFFLETINEMISDFLGIEKKLNPYHLKDDEAGGNKLAMKEVFGEDFLIKKTSSYEYHFNANVEKHARYVQDRDRSEYFNITKDLKESPTKGEYETNKIKLEVLIEKQGYDEAKKKLSSALNWWHDRRPRWALAFKTTTHNIPLSSLAEAAHASMKSAGQKNLSLVQALQADVTDSIRLEARWLNRQTGESSTGAGPSGADLVIRNKIRQHGQATYYAEKISRIDDELEDNDDEHETFDTSGLCNPTSSHRPDKASKNPLYRPKTKMKRRRSLSSKCFKDALAKAKERSLYSKVNLKLPIK